MILILTRNDIDPKFNHLLGYEITLEHTWLGQNRATHGLEVAYSGDVVFLNEDDTIHVLHENKNGREVRKYPTVLHYIASRLHRHIRLLSTSEVREIAEEGHRISEGRSRRGRFDTGDSPVTEN